MRIRFGVLTAVLSSILVAGCYSLNPSEYVGPDGAASNDAPTTQGADVPGALPDVPMGDSPGGWKSPSDSQPDLRRDLTSDIVPDLGPDFRPDLAPDVWPDLAPDVWPDLAPDVWPDLAPDLRPDFGPDLWPDL
jgi:hypothetical protein